MKYIIKVIYVFSKFDKIERLQKFINHYNINNAGIKHELIICYKLLNSKQIVDCNIILKNIKFTKFIDKSENNDFEFMTMKRAINKKKYAGNLILFLNSHCYPAKRNWLRILCDSYEEKSFVGVSGSDESMLTSFKFKKFYKIFYNLKNYFFYKNNFPSFPNPHIRLPAFLLKQNDFLQFMKDKNYKNKKDAWITEAGYESMTNYFLNKNYKVYLTNSENKKFDLQNMRKSNTFCFKESRKYLIGDRHIDKYNNASVMEKKIMQKMNWG